MNICDLPFSFRGGRRAKKRPPCRLTQRADVPRYHLYSAPSREERPRRVRPFGLYPIALTGEDRRSLLGARLSVRSSRDVFAPPSPAASHRPAALLRVQRGVTCSRSSLMVIVYHVKGILSRDLTSFFPVVHQLPLQDEVQRVHDHLHDQTFLLTMKLTVELTTRATTWLNRTLPPVTAIMTSTITASTMKASRDDAANFNMQA